MTSCEQDISNKELLDVPFYVGVMSNEYPFYLDYVFKDEAVKQLEYSENTTTEQRYKKGDTITYYGDEYKLREPLQVQKCFRLNEYPEGCAFIESSSASIFYDNATKEPLYISYRGQETAENDEIISFERAKEIAFEFIETELNGKYNKGIDIEKYELLTESGYTFKFERRVKGKIVHFIIIYMSKNGSILNWTAFSVPDEDVLERIPDYTEEEYIELALYYLKRAYKNCGEDVTISDVNVLPTEETSLLYNEALGDYTMRFVFTYDVTNDKGECDDDMTFGFTIPLDAE